MVKHVILWQIKDEYDEAKKTQIKQGIKEGLEGLQGKIPGLLEIKVYIDPLKTANCDVMLDSKFESEAALKGYTVHPDHVEVATTKVRPFVSSRVVMDCEA